MAARVLIVEDEEKIRNLLRMFLEREDLEVEEAENGLQALEKLKEKSFQLVILDIMMPEMDGWTTCRKIRQANDLPIIILTARGEEVDRVLGFELGADDYVVKPFSPQELVLRVKAHLRRTAAKETKPANKDMLTFGKFSINVPTRLVTFGKEGINLTPIEFELLHFLALYPGQVFSREQLLEKVWGYDFFGEVRTVDTHIKRLREKLARVNSVAAEVVATVWGVGYKFEVPK